MNFILCTVSIRLFRPLEGMESRSILLRNVSIGMHVLIFLYVHVNMLQFSNPPPRVDVMNFNYYHRRIETESHL